MNDYKEDYHHGLIACSATMLVVCLVVIQNNSAVDVMHTKHSNTVK